MQCCSEKPPSPLCKFQPPINLHGWLTSASRRINNPDALSTLQTGDPNIDLFGEKLLYQTSESGLNSSYPLQYNGNIAAMVWNTTGKTKQGYGFTYDGLNRLKTSSYGEGSSFASYSGANNENYAYDLNGNLTSLTRYLRGTGQIDLLTYTYKNSGASNQLDKVDDTATYPTIGFYNGVSTTGEYSYAPNGNLTSELNKGYNSCTILMTRSDIASPESLPQGLKIWNLQLPPSCYFPFYPGPEGATS